MAVPLLYVHDPGCKFAKEADGGHSDAAKRLADWYTLHRIAGARPGQYFAVRLSDGTSDGAIYDDKAQAVTHQKGDPRWFAYICIGPPSMTICEAGSVIRFQRHAYHLADVTANREDRRGGPDIIPRLTIEGRENQIAAMDGRLALPLAFGYKRRSDT